MAQSTTDEEEANLEFSMVKGLHGCAQWPLMRNSKAVKAGDALLFYKENDKKAAEPLEAASPPSSKRLRTKTTLS